MTHLEDRLDAMVRVGRALADPTRCRILLAISQGVSFPAAIADELGLTRANVSNHLACLRGCGLVTRHAEGRQSRYELTSGDLEHALADLTRVVLAVEEDDNCVTRAVASARKSPHHRARVGVAL